MINVVPLAQWIRRVPTEHEIPGSSPGWYITFKGITSGSAEVQKSLKILKKAINKVLGGTFYFSFLNIIEQSKNRKAKT